jgi:hypothetical protein
MLNCTTFLFAKGVWFDSLMIRSCGPTTGDENSEQNCYGERDAIQDASYSTGFDMDTMLASHITFQQESYVPGIPFHSIPFHSIRSRRLDGYDDSLHR